jgi:hypothetical protein
MQCDRTSAAALQVQALTGDEDVAAAAADDDDGIGAVHMYLANRSGNTPRCGKMRSWSALRKV